MADHPVASDNRDNISVLKDQICRGAFTHSVCAVGRVRGISELFDISAEPMISLSENKKTSPRGCYSAGDVLLYMSKRNIQKFSFLRSNRA